MATIDEKVLWGAAEKLRDKCDPADYIRTLFWAWSS